MRLSVTPFALRLRRPLVTAAGTWSRRPGALLRLEDGEGGVGIGEVAPHPSLPESDFPDWLASRIEETSLLGSRWQEEAGAGASGPSLFPTEGRGALPPSPWRAGLETALADLTARRRGIPLGRVWGSPQRSVVRMNGLLDELDPERAGEAAVALVSAGFRCLKLKASEPARDATRLERIRARVGAEVRLRLDANGAWTVPEAIERLRCLAAFGLDYVEEPVSGVAALAEVRRQSPVSVAADESAPDVETVDALIAAQALDVLILKPSLVGPSEALAMAQRAREAGVRVVVTSVLESSVGLTMALQVAGLIPGPEEFCGLATAGLLAQDLVDPEFPVSPSLPLPVGPGLGAEVSPVLLQQVRTGETIVID